MEVERFREAVRRAFGEDLHRASPATVREFLDRLQSEAPLLTSEGERHFRVDETARSYEEVMRTFFSHVLDLPPDKAVPLLWAVAFDLSYAIIESHDADRIGHLFRGMEEPG